MNIDQASQYLQADQKTFLIILTLNRLNIILLNQSKDNLIILILRKPINIPHPLLNIHIVLDRQAIQNRYQFIVNGEL